MQNLHLPSAFTYLQLQFSLWYLATRDTDPDLMGALARYSTSCTFPEVQALSAGVVIIKSVDIPNILEDLVDIVFAFVCYFLILKLGV